MKKYFFVALFLGLTSLMSSQNVSTYKYIILPQKFSFLKKPNQYNLNELTKNVLEKQGYEVYYDNTVFPQELAENRCKALFADMLEDNTLFMTKIKLEFKDCKNQVVFISEQGESRLKDLNQAYVQAFREVGRSLESLKSMPETPKKDLVAEVKNIEPSKNVVLFAQPVATGFQLVDNTPKVIMKLFKTSLSNVYVAQKDEFQGVVFNKNNQWYFEYQQNEKVISEKLEIKF